MLVLNSAIAQLSIYLVNALSVHASLSPPNPPVKQHERYTGTTDTDTLFERVVQHITLFSKSTVWFLTCLNTAGALVSYKLKPPAWALMTQPSLFPGPVHLVLVLGMTLTFLSAILRLWCYRTLGALFTFEITIRPKHELVQHGPYAWVRHPSYTGVYLTLIGSTCVFLAPGTWTADRGVRNPIGMLLLCLWFLKCLFVARGMGMRLRAEDHLLRTTFGVEWDEYATRVPCKFIPWIY